MDLIRFLVKRCGGCMVQWHDWWYDYPIWKTYGVWGSWEDLNFCGFCGRQLRIFLDEVVVS